MQPQQPQLDPTILNLTKAIRKAEGFNGDPNIRGKAGEWGAYQFMPKTWDNYAKELGVNAKFGQASLAQQNEVAYKKFKQWKDAGYNVGQIASMWNAGEGRPNAYAEGWRKVDPKTGEVIFDTPAYAQKVAAEYQRLKTGGQAAPIGQTQFQTTVPRETPEEGGILSQLGTGTIEPPKEPSKLDYRLGQGSDALSKLSSGVAEGDVSDIASGALQTAGTVAGGALDLVDAGLNAATFGGYNAAMDFVGKKVIAPVFGAVGGDKVMKQWQEFATEHPDAANNIGAIGNIASAIPVFKVVKQGLGAAKDVAGAAVAKTGFVKTVEEAAKAELRQSGASAPSKAGQVLTAQKIKGEVVDPVDTIVDGNYLPEIVEDGAGIPRYQTGTAMRQLDDALEVDEKTLQGMLEEASSKGIVGYVPISSLREQAKPVIIKAFVDQGDMVDVALRKADKIFDGYKKYKGDLVPLTELNNMKRGIREAVNFNSPKVSQDLRAQLGNLFMDNIEEVASKQGIKQIAEVNREMAKKIRAKEALEFLDQRSVVDKAGFRGAVNRTSKDFVTATGEAAGQASGVFGLGYLTRKLSEKAMSGSGKSVVGKLKTKRGRKKPSKALVGAALAPSLLASTQEGLQEEKR
jgi:hypothetical protein